MVALSHTVILTSILFLLFATPAISQDNELVIATDSLPPIISKNNGGSYIIEVFNEVAKEMGVTFKYKFLPWKRCEYAVKNNEAWGAIPYIETEERNKQFNFSIPIYKSHIKFFYYSSERHSQQIPFSKLADLKGLRIGGILGYYYIKTFTDAGLEVELVPDEEQNLMRLATGRVNLIAMNETTGWYLINKNFSAEQVKNFGTLDRSLSFHDASLMTSKNYPNTQEILKRFNSALLKIKENGTYQRIIDKHGIAISY